MHRTGTVNFVTKKWDSVVTEGWTWLHYCDFSFIQALIIATIIQNRLEEPQTCSIWSLSCSKIWRNEVKMEFSRFFCWILVIIQCVQAQDLLDCQSKSICGHLQTCESENQICDYDECILGKLSRAKLVTNFITNEVIFVVFRLWSSLSWP